MISSLNRPLWRLLGKNFDLTDIRWKIWKGALKYLATLPVFSRQAHCKPHFNHIDSRVAEIVRSTSRYYDDMPTAAAAIMDELHALVSQLESSEYLKHSPDLSHDGLNTTFRPIVAFWSHATVARHWEYIMSRKDLLLDDSCGDNFLAACLFITVYLPTQNKLLGPLPVMLMLLSNLWARKLTGTMSDDLPRSNMRCLCQKTAPKKELMWSVLSSLQSSEVVSDVYNGKLTRMALAKAFFGWEVALQVTPSNIGGGVSRDEFREVSEMLEFLTDPADTIFGYSLTRKLHFGMNPRLWQNIIGKLHRKSSEGDEVVCLSELHTEQHWENRTDEVSIVCYPTEPKCDMNDQRRHLGCCEFAEVHKFVIVKPRPPTIAKLIAPAVRNLRLCRRLSIIEFIGYNYVGAYHPEPRLLDECSRMLVEDIWANEQGLDATEQLLALACVRTGSYYTQERNGTLFVQQRNEELLLELQQRDDDEY